MAGAQIAKDPPAGWVVRPLEKQEQQQQQQQGPCADGHIPTPEPGFGRL
jgi:hypothetical protein